MRLRDDRRRTGMTLVEVIVSIVLLGGVMAALFVSRQRAQEAHIAAHEQMTCARLCAARVAALRAGLVTAGEGDFESPAGYHWSIARTAPPEDAPNSLEAYEVRVNAPNRTEAGAVATVWLYRPVEARRP